MTYWLKCYNNTIKNKQIFSYRKINIFQTKSFIFCKGAFSLKPSSFSIRRPSLSSRREQSVPMLRDRPKVLWVVRCWWLLMYVLILLHLRDQMLYHCYDWSHCLRDRNSFQMSWHIQNEMNMGWFDIHQCLEKWKNKI